MRNQVILVGTKGSYFTNVAEYETAISMLRYVGTCDDSGCLVTGIVFIGNGPDALTKAKILTAAINDATLK